MSKIVVDNRNVVSGGATKITYNGTATASANANTAANAFDGNTSTKWYTTTEDAYLQYTFPSAVIVNCFGIVGNMDSPYLPPTTVKLYGSNDSFSTSTLIATVAPNADTSEYYGLSNNTTAYTSYRLYCKKRDNYSQISKVDMYNINGLNLS